jgi:hypothetical protein
VIFEEGQIRILTFFDTLGEGRRKKEEGRRMKG